MSHPPLTKKQRHAIILELHNVSPRLCMEALYNSDIENYTKKQNEYIFNI